jgi:hypothetical protein
VIDTTSAASPATCWAISANTVKVVTTLKSAAHTGAAVIITVVATVANKDFLTKASVPEMGSPTCKCELFADVKHANENRSQKLADKAGVA